MMLGVQIGALPVDRDAGGIDRAHGASATSGPMPSPGINVTG